jgi:hypothetical protein
MNTGTMAHDPSVDLRNLTNQDGYLRDTQLDGKG